MSTDVSSVYACFKKNGQVGMGKVRGTRKKNPSNCYEEKIRQIAWCVAKIEMKRGRKKLPWNLGQRVACLSLSLFSATEQWRTISRFFINKMWIYRLFLLRSTQNSLWLKFMSSKKAITSWRYHCSKFQLKGYCWLFLTSK